MNESLIDTVGCLCSIAVCLCFPLFHNVHICVNVFAVFETNQSGVLILTSDLTVTNSDGLDLVDNLSSRMCMSSSLYVDCHVLEHVVEQGFTSFYHQ